MIYGEGDVTKVTVFPVLGKEDFTTEDSVFVVRGLFRRARGIPQVRHCGIEIQLEIVRKSLAD